MSTLDDEQVRNEFLKHIRNGEPRYTAAERIGLDPSTVRRYLRAHPEFDEMVLDSEERAFEPIQTKMRNKALEDGDVSAARMVQQLLRKRDEAAKRQHTTTIMIEDNRGLTLEALTKRIEEVAATAQQRKELSQVTISQDLDTVPTSHARSSNQPTDQMIHPHIDVVDAEIVEDGLL